MTVTSLVNILRNSLDKLYEVIPSNDNQKLIKEIYNQLINPEAITLNSILKNESKIKEEHYQFHRILIILTMISDFFEFHTYKHYKEDTDKISNDIYQILNDDCDFKKAINLFFQNSKYAKKIIETYTLYDKKDKSKYIEYLLNHDQIEKLLKINPYIFVDYMYQFRNKLSEEDKIIDILKECSINDDNNKTKSILDSDSIIINANNEVSLISDGNIISAQTLNSNQFLKQSFLSKLNDHYNGKEKSINNAIRYIVYDVLNGMIKLSNNNLIDRDNMKKILNITDANLYNQEKIVEEFMNNEEFSNAVLDIFNDIHYTYNGLIDLLTKDNINDTTKKFIKRYNPFEQDN